MYGRVRRYFHPRRALACPRRSGGKFIRRSRSDSLTTGVCGCRVWEYTPHAPVCSLCPGCTSPQHRHASPCCGIRTAHRLFFFTATTVPSGRVLSVLPDATSADGSTSAHARLQSLSRQHTPAAPIWISRAASRFWDRTESGSAEAPACLPTYQKSSRALPTSCRH